MQSKKAGFIFVALIAAFGLLTPIFNILLTRGPSMTPAEVRNAMSSQPEKNLLVDLYDDDTYAAYSIPGVMKVSRFSDLSSELLRSKDKVFLLCDTGWLSSMASRCMRAKGLEHVYCVSGGVEAWIAGLNAPCKTGLCAADATAALQVRKINFTRFEQFILCACSFGLKPIYELLALAMAMVIWKKKETYWCVTRWALVAFFLGENACAINYLVYGLENFTWEFWHCYGMMVATGLGAYAAVEFVDQTLIHCEEKDKSCSFLGLCKGCYKYQPVSCNLRILFLFAAPAMAVLCFMPFCVPFRDFMSRGLVFGDEVLFTHSKLQQMYEIRVYPVFAMIFFALSWVVLMVKKEVGLTTTKMLFAAGLGPFAFCMMRFILFWVYSDNTLWADVWEELTEFLAMIAMLVLLNVKRLRREHSISKIP